MNTSPAGDRAHTERGPAAGFSLIELMVAMTIGLLLILAMATLLAQQNKARSALENSAAQFENGRYAVNILRSDIELAGFYGQFSGAISAPTVLPNACETSDLTSIDAALALPLQGYNDVSAIPATLAACLLSANVRQGTDILVVRRLETSDPAALPSITSATPNRLYVQTTPVKRILERGQNAGNFTLVKNNGVTPADLRALVVRIYFVSPCNVLEAGQSVCTQGADGGTPIPTLKRLELNATGGANAFVLTPLVEGIEDMQFEYGVDNEGVGGPAFPFIASPSLAQWRNVVAANIVVLARNPRETRGLLDKKSYNLGLKGTVGPFNDAFRRHVYTSSARVMNVSGRRE